MTSKQVLNQAFWAGSAYEKQFQEQELHQARSKLTTVSPGTFGLTTFKHTVSYSYSD